MAPSDASYEFLWRLDALFSLRHTESNNDNSNNRGPKMMLTPFSQSPYYVNSLQRMHVYN